MPSRVGFHSLIRRSMPLNNNEHQLIEFENNKKPTFFFHPTKLTDWLVLTQASCAFFFFNIHGIFSSSWLPFRVRIESCLPGLCRQRLLLAPGQIVNELTISIESFDGATLHKMHRYISINICETFWDSNRAQVGCFIYPLLFHVVTVTRRKHRKLYILDGKWRENGIWTIGRCDCIKCHVMAI